MTETSEDTQRIIFPVSAPPRLWPHLLIVEGPGAGQVFRLIGPHTVIGRAPFADVCLLAPSVSRRHALVSISNDQLTIEDLKSRNGTFVGMDRVQSPRGLSDGAVVTIGDVTLLKITYSVATDEAVRRAVFESASRDPATRFSNTWHFLDRLRHEHAYARRHRSPLTLVFFRLDGAAAWVGNDSKTNALDPIMRDIAGIIRDTVRAEDLLARASDDELLALVRADERQATAMAERVRVRAREGGTTKQDTLVAPETISAAVIPLAPTAIMAPETILVAARDLARAASRNATDKIIMLEALNLGPHESMAGLVNTEGSMK